MTQRDYFVQLVSQGPGKIPFGFAIEAFDMAERQFRGVVQEASAPVTVVLDPNFVAKANDIINQTLAAQDNPSVKRDLTAAEAEEYVKAMTKRIQKEQAGWAVEGQQDNAEALKNLAVATAKGRVENETRIQSNSTPTDI